MKTATFRMERRRIEARCKAVCENVWIEGKTKILEMLKSMPTEELEDLLFYEEGFFNRPDEYLIMDIEDELKDRQDRRGMRECFQKLRVTNTNNSSTKLKNRLKK